MDMLSVLRVHTEKSKQNSPVHAGSVVPHTQ